jgi:UDP-perosamine 4-acetyltransferase
MNLPVILVGAGGHAKVVLSVLHLLGHKVIGVVDPQLVAQKQVQWRHIPVLGEDEVVFEFPRDEVLLANGIGSLPGNDLRERIYTFFTQKGYAFATLVHPDSITMDGVKLAQGAQVMAGVVLQPDVELGCNSLINTGARVDHDCHIGDHCHVAPGAILSGDVTLEDRCHVGPGAVVVQGCHLAHYTVIGANTTCLSDTCAGDKILGAKPRVFPYTANKRG